MPTSRKQMGFLFKRLPDSWLVSEDPQEKRPHWLRAVERKMMLTITTTLNNRRVIMNHFLQQIETALLPAATQYAPVGSEPKSIAHRFSHT